MISSGRLICCDKNNVFFASLFALFLTHSSTVFELSHTSNSHEMWRHEKAQQYTEKPYHCYLFSFSLHLLISTTLNDCDLCHNWQFSPHNFHFAYLFSSKWSMLLRLLRFDFDKKKFTWSFSDHTYVWCVQLPSQDCGKMFKTNTKWLILVATDYVRRLPVCLWKMIKLLWCAICYTYTWKSIFFFFGSELPNEKCTRTGRRRRNEKRAKIVAFDSWRQ